MRWILATAVLAVLAVGAWSIGSVLSSDAVGMVIGLLFGTMATVPGALLVLVAARREQSRRDPYYPPPHRYEQPPAQPPAQLPGPVTIVFEDAQGRRATMQFSDPDAARRFLAEGGR